MTDNNETSNKKMVSQVPQLMEQGNFWKAMALLLFAIIVLTQLFDVRITPKLQILQSLLNTNQTQSVTLNPDNSSASIDTNSLSQQVLPSEGLALPITWGDLGKKMIDDGVIDEAKFRALFEGGLTNQDEQILTGNVTEPIVINQENSRFILDILWAFGLGNKNEILEMGEMTDPEYGGDASQFASTGGWSLAKGPGFDHYSKHAYVMLSSEQQALVDEVSRGIYRPCCGNSTHFPDCNHGMAMLGLLELMAKNGVSKEEMYRVALQVNAYWFPQTYMDLATYFKEQGQDWNQVDPKIVLGKEYSSAQGYQQARQQIQSLPEIPQGGGGCGA